MLPLFRTSWALALAAALWAVPTAHALEAGAAKIDITPPLGTPLLGHEERLGRGATAVHDPLWARTLYLDDGATSVYLVSLDLFMVPAALRERVLALAPSVTPPENIVLTATHTHSGTGGMEPKLPGTLWAGAFAPEVLESTAQAIADSMRQAYDARRRAALGYAVIKNDSLGKPRFGGGDAVDGALGVIRVDDADGEAIAILACFSAMPDTVPEGHLYTISADYPGVLYGELERLANPGCVAFFLNGAPLDQALANPESKSGWEYPDASAKLLAVLVKGAANKIAGDEAALQLSYAETPLPPAISPMLYPDAAIFQALEINGLMIAFLPCAPTARVAARLRAQAMARGYDASLVVGLANGYVGGITARDEFGKWPELAVNTPFGPGAEDWLAERLDALMTRGEPTVQTFIPGDPETEAIAGGAHIKVFGTPRAMGAQWGAAFQGLVRDAYAQRIVEPVRRGDAKAHDRLWDWWPSILDPTVLALPRTAALVRPAYAALPPDSRAFIEGMANGAGVPLDEVWASWQAAALLKQNATPQPGPAPRLTAFAITGQRAGADDLWAGQHRDGAGRSPFVAATFLPEEGIPVTAICEAGDASFQAGMNGAGVVICLESFPGEGPYGPARSLLSMRLRELLHSADSVEAARTGLRGIKQPLGWHILLAGPVEKGIEAMVVTLGGEGTDRKADETGILFAGDPAGESYTRLSEALSSERIVGREELEGVLTPAGEPPQSLWTGRSQYTVLFEPKQRKIHVVFANETGAMEQMATITVPKGSTP